MPSTISAAMLVYEATRRSPDGRWTVTTPLGPAPGRRLETQSAAGPGPAGRARAAAQCVPPASRCRVPASSAWPATRRPSLRSYVIKLPAATRAAARASCSTRCWPPAARSITPANCYSTAVPPSRSSWCACSPRPRASSDCAQTGIGLTIVTASVDSHLNEQAFIVPGLGDAGDRQFGARAERQRERCASSRPSTSSAAPPRPPKSPSHRGGGRGRRATPVTRARLGRRRGLARGVRRAQPPHRRHRAPWRPRQRPVADRPGRTAIIEMAQASGLLLAGGAEGNDPMAASTTGTGELIDAALDAGAEAHHRRPRRVGDHRRRLRRAPGDPRASSACAASSCSSPATCAPASPMPRGSSVLRRAPRRRRSRCSRGRLERLVQVYRRRLRRRCQRARRRRRRRRAGRRARRARRRLGARVRPARRRTRTRRARRARPTW